MFAILWGEVGNFNQWRSYLLAKILITHTKPIITNSGEQENKIELIDTPKL